MSGQAEAAAPPLRREPARPREPARLVESGWLGAAGFLIPLLSAAGLNRGAALFRSDAAVLAALDGGASLPGSFARTLAQLALALPLGSASFRLALSSALGLAVFSWALAELSRALFFQGRGQSRLDPWLATGAGLAGSMHLLALSEGTVIGGAVWGPAFCAWLLARVLRRGVARTRRGAALDGGLLGLTLAESPWCALVAVVAVLVFWPEGQAPIRWRGGQHVASPVLSGLRARTSAWLGSLRGGAGASCIHAPARAGASWWQRASCGAVLSTTAVLVPLALWSPVLGSTTAEHLSQLTDRPEQLVGWSFFEWAGQSGLLWFAGALLGCASGLKERRALLPFAALLLLDWTVPHAPLGGWTGELTHEPSRMALHLLAVGSVAAWGALGLRRAVQLARAFQLFGARQLSVLVSIIAVAGSLARAEDAVAQLTETETRAAEVWTEEALGTLPAGALVLTHRPELGRRLLSAQATGERPDVLVLPISELTDPRRVAAWLEREPALDLLLRDLSLSETPSERAVARLVDARPVYVEPDPSWDRRLLEHLWPGLPLARMSAHALGHSDRESSLEERRSSMERISAWTRAGLVPERATARVLDELLDALGACLEQIDHRSLELLRTQRATLAPPPAQESPAGGDERASTDGGPPSTGADADADASVAQVK